MMFKQVLFDDFELMLLQKLEERLNKIRNEIKNNFYFNTILNMLKLFKQV